MSNQGANHSRANVVDDALAVTNLQSEKPGNPFRRKRFVARFMATAVASVLVVYPVHSAFAQSTTISTPGAGGAVAASNAQQSTYNPTDHTSVGQGGCADQYTSEMNSLGDQAAADNITGQLANGVALGASIYAWGTSGGEFTAAGASLNTAGPLFVADVPAVGTSAPAAVPIEAAGASLDSAGGTSISAGIALGAQVVNFATGLDGAHIQQQQADLTDYTSTLPSCDAQFSGTVNADANVNVGQGVSADGGAINLGNPDGVSYQSGITVGGGAISGAGSSGAAPGDNSTVATTGNVDAIAIGNGGANADDSGSIAFGLRADSTNTNAIAIGTDTVASGLNSFAGGNGSQAIGDYSVALGDPNIANGANSVAIGNNNTSNGDSSIALGDTNTSDGINSIAQGQSNHSIGDNSIAEGNANISTGTSSIALGDTNQSIGINSIAQGQSNTSGGLDSIALGT